MSHQSSGLPDGAESGDTQQIPFNARTEPRVQSRMIFDEIDFAPEKPFERYEQAAQGEECHRLCIDESDEHVDIA